MRVLVLRALGLGDLLTAVPALRGLRRAHPDAHLQLACPGVLAPLVELIGGVDEVVDAAPLGSLPARVAGADLAVNLHGRGPQSTALLDATGPRTLLAWGRNSLRWRADEHEVQRWCRLLTDSGIPCWADDLEVQPASGSACPGATLVHPGAAKPSRRWPASRWARVCRGLLAAGHDVVVTAGPGERALAEAVAPAGVAVCEPGDLRSLAALVGSARLLLSPDTGVAHLATALRVPSVTLFGPTPPQLWGPPADRPWHRALWAGRPGDNESPGVDPGLLAVSVEQVLAAADAADRARPVGAAAGASCSDQDPAVTGRPAASCSTRDQSAANRSMPNLSRAVRRAPADSAAASSRSASRRRT